MRKALVAAVLGSLIILVSPTPASAHADMDTSSPANGAVLAKAPKTITLSFSEPVDVDTVQVLDGQARPLTSATKVNGASIIVTPAAALPAGAITTQWKVKSDDGHVVTGAVSFIVGSRPVTGRPVTVTTTPHVPTVLSGARAGQLSVGFTTAMTSGEVAWSTQSLTGPITWVAVGNGRKATATGVLPFPGTWTMQATLVGKAGQVVVTTGTVTLG
ncbi:MAG: copper resistance protein CopC [Candidatus Nanopelagicales bacterium]|nr:copper resistance protein CopC [Candidatus Nanopelagicales bacterium]